MKSNTAYAPIMSVKEFSAASGLSKYAVRAGIRAGSIPAFRVSEGSGKLFIYYDVAMQALGGASRHDTQDYDQGEIVYGIRRVNA